MSKKLRDKGKPIITDTSPLLLLLMGLYDKNAIGEFKRLSEYDSVDYDLLFQFVAKRRIVKFGFTDTSIILAAKENNALVLTDDFPLFGMCKKIGLEAMHINNIQSQKEIF